MQQESLMIAEEQEIVRQPMNPMQILASAVDKGVSPETLEKLMALAERYQANVAKQAFTRALTEFKADPPEIFKNKHVKFGQTEYDHATLDHVTDQIGAALSRHGLSHTWSMKQEGNAIYVTCTLTHKEGHSEAVTLSAGSDTSGSKNAIQAIGSTVTYLQRYTLLAATGLAARNGDDDGQSGGHALENLSDWIAAIEGCNSEAQLKDTYTKAYRAAEGAGDRRAQEQIVAAKDKRRKELK